MNMHVINTPTASSVELVILMKRTWSRIVQDHSRRIMTDLCFCILHLLKYGHKYGGIYFGTTKGNSHIHTTKSAKGILGCI